MGSSIPRYWSFHRQRYLHLGDFEKYMTDPLRCSKCGADVEETYTERICQGCGELELFCTCERA